MRSGEVSGVIEVDMEMLSSEEHAPAGVYAEWVVGSVRWVQETGGVSIGAKHSVVPWLVEYASYLLNRMELGHDGKTAYERNKGKSATVLGVEFGEKLVWKKKSGQKMNKINSKWEFGIFVGVRQKSGEIWVATPDGIHKARSVRRIAKQDRWTQDSLEWVRHVPWKRYKDQEDDDGDIPEEKAVDAEPGRERRQDEERTIIVGTRQVAPRAFYIRKEDAEVHGYTRSCPGCSSWFRGIGRQPHTAECRARFAELMKEDAKFKNAEKRKFVSKLAQIENVYPSVIQ